MQEKHGNTWRYDFVKGNKRYKKSGFKTKEEAKQAEAEARTGAKSISTDFLKLANSRLEDIEIRRSKKHFQENKVLFEELMNTLGTLDTIGHEDVKKYLNEVARQSKTLANRKLKLIKALFNHGIKNHWFYINPCTGIEKFGVDKKQKRYIPPKEDIEKVLAVADQEQRRYLLVIIHTIARVREINRLKWEDVNFEKRYVTLWTRKSKNSDMVDRNIPMNNTLYLALSTAPRNGEYVFINKWTKKNFDYRDKLLGILCEKAGVERFTYHCLRHYGASKLAEANTPLTDIQEILGHQRATTTDIYLQSLKGSSIEAMKRLEDVPPKIPQGL